MMVRISKWDPDKINELPEDIQKLLWRTFFYLSQIENYLNKFCFRRDRIILKKFYGYCSAFENMERIIEKKIRQKGLDIDLCYNKN